MIIGCDYDPSWQQIAWLDSETGECGERKLVHAMGDAKVFYQQLVAPVLIGMEATGNSQWFIELVQDMGHEIWIGDAAQIRASYVRIASELQDGPIVQIILARRPSKGRAFEERGFVILLWLIRAFTCVQIVNASRGRESIAEW